MITKPCRTLLVALFLVPAVLAWAQVAPAAGTVGELADLPPEYEATIRELVDRYEEMRALLRREMERNAGLMSAAEIDQAVAEVRAELELAQATILAWQGEYKRASNYAKQGFRVAQFYKEQHQKAVIAHEREVTILRATLAGIDEERLLAVGTTFYPEGFLGATLQVNIPGSPLGFYVEGLYRTREQDYFYGFGVNFAFLRQRHVVEGWERLRTWAGWLPRAITERGGAPAGESDPPAEPTASTSGSGVELPRTPREQTLPATPIR